MHKGLSIFFISLNLFGNTKPGQIFNISQWKTRFKENRITICDKDFSKFPSMYQLGDENYLLNDNGNKKIFYHNSNQNSLSFVLVFAPCFDPAINNMEYVDSFFYGKQVMTHKPSEHFTNILKPPRII